MESLPPSAPLPLPSSELKMSFVERIARLFNFNRSQATAFFHRLRDSGTGIDEDAPPRVLTPAERELQKHFFVAEDEWRACKKLVFFPVGPAKQAWDCMPRRGSN